MSAAGPLPRRSLPWGDGQYGQGGLMSGPDEGSDGGLREAIARKGSFMQTMKAVAWSFFGVRKGSEYEKDVSQLNPLHVIIAGIAGRGAVRARVGAAGQLGARQRRRRLRAHTNSYRGENSNMSAATQHGHHAARYFVPEPSRHPVMAAAGLFFVILGAGQWINGVQWGKWSLLFGFALWAFTMFHWFRDAIGESERGLYGKNVDVSFRWSMSWFIFSEVMFFAAFFGALFWSRLYSIPVLGDLDHKLLWPDFKAVWPSVAPGATASPAAVISSRSRRWGRSGFPPSTPRCC